MTHQHTYQRLLAIGDIHGCYHSLQELLRQVAPTASDRLIFLGDYVDRGPDNCAVLDYLCQLQQQWPQTICLRGNHDQMFMDYLQGNYTEMFLFNGGNATLDSYRPHEVPENHRRFLQQLPLYWQEDGFVFVHAGIRPGIPLQAQAVDDLLWIREEFLQTEQPLPGYTVVHGHTPQSVVSATGHCIGLDTGAVYGGRLSCCDVRSGHLWQVDAVDGRP